MEKCEKKLQKDLNKLLGIKNKTLVLKQPFSLFLADGDYLDAVVVEVDSPQTFKIGTTNNGGQIFNDTVTGYEVITVDKYSSGGLTLYFSGYSDTVKVHFLIQKVKL